MTKSDQVKQLIPEFYKGELSIQDIADKIECHYSTVSQVITRHKLKVIEIEKMNFKKENETNFELSIKSLSEDNTIKKAKTIADWSTMTEEEKNEYK
jgi:predicted DNA-binding protein YlxM (UPF0122 family)